MQRSNSIHELRQAADLETKQALRDVQETCKETTRVLTEAVLVLRDVRRNTT